MTESEFTRKLCEHLRKDHQVMIFACVGQQMQSGWPDRYMVHWKFEGWFEFKARNKRPTPLQAVVLKALWNRRPGHSWLIEMPGIIRLPYEPWTSVGTFTGADAHGAEAFMKTMELLIPLYEKPKLTS